MVEGLLRILRQNALAAVALFVALGGTSLALTQREKVVRARAAAAGPIPAVQYVAVNSQGAIDPAHSNAPGVAMSNQRPGVFCFSGFATPPDGIAATLIAGTNAVEAKTLTGAILGCPSGTQATVEMISSRGKPQGAPFYALFFFSVQPPASPSP